MSSTPRPRRSDDAAARAAAGAFVRMRPPAQLALLLAIALIAGLWLWVHRTRQVPPVGPPDPGQVAAPSAPQATGDPFVPAPLLSPHLLLGNPSDATADVSNRANYLMLKQYFALSYNEPDGIPNWVSWRVTKEDFGNAPRKRSFDPDDQIPPGFRQITSADYTASGFDRGHLCPHADRDADQESSFATFVMTNIIPQAPNLNQKTWNHLEAYCRELAGKQRFHLYIVAGGIGTGGVGKAGPRQTIANGHVRVPAECWKIIVAVPEAGGGDDLLKLNASTRVIAVIMPNDEAVATDWKSYRTSPAQVERRTGYHFFTRVRPDLAQVLRLKVDGAATPSRPAADAATGPSAPRVPF